MANTPEGSSLHFFSLIMHKLENEGRPDFVFLFLHFEEMKADGCVFRDDTKTGTPPQKSASQQQWAASSTTARWHHGTGLLLWQTSLVFSRCNQGTDAFYSKLHKKIWLGFDIKCLLFLSLQLGPWDSSLTHGKGWEKSSDFSAEGKTWNQYAVHMKRLKLGNFRSWKILSTCIYLHCTKLQEIIVLFC